jgi:signal transduction histidine kinase
MIIALILVACTLFVVTTTVTHIMVIGSVEKIETENAVIVLSGVNNILKTQADSLLYSNHDWSNWDSTYQFARGENPDFDGNDFSSESLKNLDINLFLVLDKNGDSFFVSTNIEGEWTNTAVKQILASKDFIPNDENWKKKGYTSIAGKTILLAANPILTSNSAGPIGGTLIWGRIMNEERIAALVPFAGTNIRLSANPIGQSSEQFIGKLNETQLIGKITIDSDLTGFETILVTALLNRVIYQEVFAATNQFLFAFFIIGVIIVIACICLIDITLIKSFTDINNQILKIDANQTLRPIIYNKTNELGQLVDGINKLLKEIEVYKNQLSDSERLAAIGQTASMVGHDLRNPLQTITLTSYLLRKDPVDDKQRQLLLDTIDAQTMYMDKIVGDIQMYSNAATPHLVKCDILKLAADALALMKIPHGIRVKIESNPILPQVDVDSYMIKRVFSNLILNSIQAMPDGGTIRVYADEIDGQMIVSVQDNGPGIAESVMPYLFKPFFTTKAKGSGLGLASSKKIIESHGGVVSVGSQLGLGSRFFFSIPLKKNTDEQPVNPFTARTML